MDYKAHNETYAGFLTLFKVGTIVSALVGFVVIMLISH
ncbi:aa3-type cytochrome c oxidase subunit IV [Sphingomonas sp. YR710]|nr:aa3-type cytochrome c oxidase subunit IV [Sphingomonas sp. YR710]